MLIYIILNLKKLVNKKNSGGYFFSISFKILSVLEKFNLAIFFRTSLPYFSTAS